MVDELDIGDAAVLVQADADGNEEIIFRRRSEGAGKFGIDDDVFGGSHIILTVDKGLANATDFLGLDKDDFVGFILDFLGNEAESLVEGEHLLALVDDFREAILEFVLVKLQLNAQVLMISIVAHLELGEVAELSNERVLLVATEETEADWLDFLVGF